MIERNYDVITFISKYFILRRSRVAIFADIIKIVAKFIKIICKILKKVKRIRNFVSKSNLYLYFLIWQNLLISGKKELMSAELTDVLRDSHTFNLL